MKRMLPMVLVAVITLGGVCMSGCDNKTETQKATDKAKDATANPPKPPAAP